MFNWKSLDFVYLYDGSFDGLLTMVFECYVQKAFPSKILPETNYETNLIEQAILIPTDTQKAQRIANGILRSISYEAYDNAYHAFLSNESTKELAIVQYLCNGFILGPSISTMLSLPFVFQVVTLRKKVLQEAHRMFGFVRFVQVGANLFYSCVHLDHNVISIIGKHFIHRLPSQQFIIVDQNRNIAFCYDTATFYLANIAKLTIPPISSEEKEYQNLWKAFFKTIAIPERKNPKLQASYMPRRYWQDLIEEVN